MVEENKPVAVDPAQLLKALSPLLGSNGEIKGAAEMDRAVSLMKDAKKLVSRCVYINILKVTKSDEILTRFIGRGGWELMYTWLKDAKGDDNVPFLMDMLRFYQNVPMTINVLKMNNTPKTIKSLSKSEDSRMKTLATELVDKWMKAVTAKPTNESSDKKKSKQRERRHHRSNKDKDSPAKEDNQKDKNSKHDSSKSNSSPATKKERVSSTESVTSNTSDNSKSSKGPRTTKAPPSLYRSTGLEMETVLPPSKKKTIVVDKEKLLAAKRSSNTKPSGTPPEKRSKTTPAKEPKSPTVTSPTETKNKIKLIPPRPKPQPTQIYDSSDFMDALVTQTHVAPRRKRKPSATSPGVKKDPTSPTIATTPTKKEPNDEQDVSKKDTDDIKEANDKEDTSVEMKDVSKDNEDPTSPVKKEEDKKEGVVLSFYKDTMETDEEKKSQDGSENSENKENEDKESESGSDVVGKKKKKKVSWAEESHLTSVFYFELDENERVNVNHLKQGFEDSRKSDYMSERHTIEQRKRDQDVSGHMLWRRPPPISNLPPQVTPPGANSKERQVQRDREQGVLQALYFSKEMIPDSPKEPEAEAVEVDEPKEIPLQDKTGDGETFVDHSRTPIPKAAPGAASSAPSTSSGPKFSLPPEIANMLGSMAQEYTQNPKSVSSASAAGGAALNENIQKMLNNIIDQNPAASGNEDMKAQLKRMMESGPIREQIQAWASGQNMAWPPPPNVPPPNMQHPNGLLQPPVPPPNMMIPPPGMPPPGMMGGPPPGPPPPPFHGQWGPGPMRGPPPPPNMMRGGGRPPRMGRGGMPPRMDRMDRMDRRHHGQNCHQTVCQFFIKGTCGYGKGCKFLHPGVNGPP